MIFFSKKSYVYLLVALLAAVCFSIYYFNIPIRTVHNSGELSKSYSTLDELKQEAELIVEINADDVTALKYKDVVFTLSKANIIKVYKGNVKEKENLTILETGGIYNNTEYVFEENPAFKKNEKAIVFLKKYSGPITENAYVVLGVFQGKFKLKDSNVIIPSKHTVGELEKIKSRSDLKLN